MILGRPGAVELMRFRAEAEAMAAVRHPNVAQVFEAGEADGCPFLAMELLSTGTLEDYFKSNRGEGPVALAGVVRKVAAGVAAAHAAGIVHRDLKPGNVLFDERGEPKVTDFGLAKRGAAAGPTATGAVMGTPAYMAPEQAGGNAKFVGPAADVWSLGVILYQALTGARPFVAEDARGTLAQVLTAEPVPPRKLAPAVPRDLELICLKCLSKPPHERYPTALELANDLDRFARGEPISVRPVGRAARAVKWVRRHPAQAGLWAAVAVAALALVGVGVALAYQAELETANGKLASANAELTSARDDLQRSNATLAGTNRELEDATAKLRSAEAGLKEAFTREKKSRSYNRVSLAFAEWQRNDTARARQYLAECPEEFRGWEWDYVNRLLSPLRDGIKTGPVRFLAVSPDGKTLAAGHGDDGVVKLFDVATGEEKFTLQGHGKPPRHILFSRDGKYLATGGADDAVRVWEVATGKEVCKLPGHKNSVQGVAFNADGTRLATGDDRTVRVWETATGKRLHAFEANCGGSVKALAFHPTTPTLFAASSSLEVLDLSRPDAPRPNPIGLAGMVWTMTFHPDGTRLVLALMNGSVLFSDPLELFQQRGPRKPPVTIKVSTAPVTGVAFSRDGKRFGATAMDGTVKVLDGISFQEVATTRVTYGAPLPGAPPGAPPMAPPAVFARDLFAAAAPHADGTVKFWPVTDDPSAALNIRVGTVSAVALSADGSRAATAVPKLRRSQLTDSLAYGLSGWETATGRFVLNFADKNRKDWELWDEGPILGVAFSPAGDRIATAHATDWYLDPPEIPPDPAKWSTNFVKVWDAASGKVVLTLKGHTASVAAVAYTAGGARIVSASQDGTLRVWDAADGRPLATHAVVVRPPEKKVQQPKAPPRGKGGKKVVPSWELEDQDRWPPEVKPLFAGAAFSRDGRRLAAATLDGSVRVWDAESGKELAAFKPHDKAATALAFAPDGRRVLTGGEDKVVRVWGEDGREARAYVGHVGAVTAVALSPDGARLASGDRLGVVKLWDAETGQEAFSAKGAGVKWLAFHPDGMRLLLAGDATLKVWDARPATGPRR